MEDDKVEEVVENSNIKPSKRYNGKNFKMITELKKELSMAKKFIEYFAIIGLDPKIALENFLFNSTLEELQKCYKKELKPGIISKFPPIRNLILILMIVYSIYAFQKN